MSPSAPSTFLPDTQIEIINPSVSRGQIRYALFDFDGTLSLIREGWQDVMVPMMVEKLVATQCGESPEKLELLVREYVTRLTGKQTIYQMIELKSQIEQRGGTGEEPVTYKHEYLERLWARIRHRVDALNAGDQDPTDYVIPGTYELLDALQTRQVEMYLASGTDLPCVQSEVKTLHLNHYFGDHVYAALDAYQKFSKKMIIARLLKEKELHGPELVSFGDGYVEIENTKEVGGIAVGVASDEKNPQTVDAWKRQRLIEAGADIIIPHYRELAPLLHYLFAED